MSKARQTCRYQPTKNPLFLGILEPRPLIEQALEGKGFEKGWDRFMAERESPGGLRGH